MNDEKRSVVQETKRRFVWRTIKEGFWNIANGKQTALFVILNVITVVIIIGYYSVTPSYMDNFLRDTLPIMFLLIEIQIIFACGYRKGSYSMYRDFIRIGHVNSAGEAPILKSRQNDNGVISLTYTTKGIPLIRWQEAIESIQSALNMTIVSIRAGQDHRSVVVKAVPTADILNHILPWDDHYVDFSKPTRFVLGKDAAGQTVAIDLGQMPHGLIAGSTGSGKTSLAVIMLIQALMLDYDVKILDFKGLDFSSLHRKYGTQIITDMDSIINELKNIEQTIIYRRELFQQVGSKDLNDYCNKTGDRMKRSLVYIDECAMLTDYGTSKDAKQKSAEVIDRLAGIARVGRAFGVHLLISTQRPDA